MSWMAAAPSWRTYLERLCIVSPSDPILAAAKKLGFEVTLYEPLKAPWGKFFQLVLECEVYMITIAVASYFSYRQESSSQRTVSALAILGVLFGWPYLYGQSGLCIIDFGMPAVGFLGSLHLIDIFFLRPREQVLSWSFARFYCQLLAFPNENPKSPNPRLTNLKNFQWCVYKLFAINILLYAVPPPQLFSEVKSMWAYMGYNSLLGLIVLFVLGCIIESVLLVDGMILGIEMNQMFNNPLCSTNLRAFWGNWNLAIKDALHRVTFAVNRKKKELEKKGYRDMLSDTEVDTPDRTPDRTPQRTPHRTPTTSPGPKKRSNLEVPAQNNKHAVEQKPSKSNKAFWKKASSAMFTFFLSGLYHEYMNLISFNGASGESVLFFLVHGFGTISYVWLVRNFPEIPKRTPSWVGVLIVNAFCLLTASLFCMPFVRVGFFDQLKDAGIFGPVRGFIWLFGH